jgi:hypothetical protein
MASYLCLGVSLLLFKINIIHMRLKNHLKRILKLLTRNYPLLNLLDINKNNQLMSKYFLNLYFFNEFSLYLEINKGIFAEKSLLFVQSSIRFVTLL